MYVTYPVKPVLRFRCQLQLKHQQQWGLAAEELGRFLRRRVLPGPADALLQLLRGTSCYILSSFIMFVYFLSLLLSHLCCRTCTFVRVHMQMGALPQLTVRQLAEMSATPGQLNSSAQVATVMKHVPSERLSAFFDDFSPAISVSVKLNTNS